VSATVRVAFEYQKGRRNAPALFLLEAKNGPIKGTERSDAPSDQDRRELDHGCSAARRNVSLLASVSIETISRMNVNTGTRFFVDFSQDSSNDLLCLRLNREICFANEAV
jgi:hypothetical protein